MKNKIQSDFNGIEKVIMGMSDSSWTNLLDKFP